MPSGPKKQCSAYERSLRYTRPLSMTSARRIQRPRTSTETGGPGADNDRLVEDVIAHPASLVPNPTIMRGCSIQ